MKGRINELRGGNANATIPELLGNNMKHHWADFLMRDLGHWNFTENRHRWSSYFDDLENVPANAETVTINSDTKNWKHLPALTSVDELTLHEAKREHLQSIKLPPNIKRLRITHARPQDINFIAEADQIEELILEYVSGFNDLTPITHLPNLRAVHFENLRGMRDYSPLGKAPKLQNVSIYGTTDWYQPVNDFSFVNKLKCLEHLGIVCVKGEQPLNTLTTLSTHKHLKSLSVQSTVFTLEEFAWLFAATPNATQGHNKLSITVRDYITFLGRGERRIKASAKNAPDKVAQHQARYNAAFNAAMTQLQAQQ